MVLFGGFLTHLALGAIYTVGNFAPYFISYIRNRTDDTAVRNVDSLWIQASGSFGNCLGLVVGGMFAHKFGARVATFIGAVVFCGSVASNYFSVNKSFIALVFTYGLMRYLGHKLTYGAPVQTAIKWLPEHSTLAAGLIVSGTGGGSLIFNQVITAYVNPDNVSPDLITEDGSRYFTQPELLDRVPTCFLVLGATYFGMQLIGIACLSEPSITQTTVDSKDILVAEKKPEVSASINTIQLTSYSVKDEVTGQNVETGTLTAAGYYDNDKVVMYENNAFQPTEMLDMKTTTEDKAKDKDSGTAQENSSPARLDIIEAVKFALRCRSFYIVWFTMMLINGGMQFINSLYKAYGQTFIDDDHFLALVGSLGAIFNCIGRPIWGAVMDKAGFRVAIRCVSGGFVVTTATLLLTEHLSKYVFLLWICALYFFFCGIWSIMPSTIAKLLGPEHMSINYGIIYTGLSAVSILGSIFGTSLKSEIGWHGLFFMASGLGAIVFFLSFLFNGVDRNGRRI